jgi:hypothetical protein
MLIPQRSLPNVQYLLLESRSISHISARFVHCRHLGNEMMQRVSGFSSPRILLAVLITSTSSDIASSYLLCLRNNIASSLALLSVSRDSTPGLKLLISSTNRICSTLASVHNSCCRCNLTEADSDSPAKTPICYCT